MIQKRKKIQEIPGPEEWAGYKDDMDAHRAHSFWFGKSHDDVQQYFRGGQSIQRGGELLYMPQRAFQFYIFSLAQYVMSEAAIGDADAAVVFLSLLQAREQREPGSVAQLYARLAPTIDFVAASQARYHASHDIYGDFAERGEKLKALRHDTPAQLNPEDQMLDPTDDA